MRTKSQAFLELQDIDSSKTMINYYHYCPPTVRQQPVCLHSPNIKNFILTTIQIK